MNSKRKNRLLWIGGIVLVTALAIGLVLYALKQNINLFFSPTQIANKELPLNQRGRIGGMVVKNSVQRDPNSLAVQFQITDFAATIMVKYTGILPDLFREGQGVIAQGMLDNQGFFQADEVLAKHDEKYMPPEVADALKKSGQAQALGVQP